MANIYKGKMTSLEYAATDSWPGTALGEVADCEINFEPEKFEGLIHTHPVGGMGTAKMVLAEAASALRTTLEGLINEDYYFRATDKAGNTYVFHGPVTLEESRPFDDPKTPHTYTILVERYDDTAEDFCAAPAD